MASKLDERLLHAAATRRKRRGSGWSMRMAVRSLLTSIGAILIAFFLNASVLPNLATEAESAGTHPPAAVAWLLDVNALMPFVPMLSLVLAVLAIAIRPLRGLLALAASLIAILAVAMIVATLAAALAPLYTAPNDLTGLTN
jgi:hypothetical protein